MKKIDIENVSESEKTKKQKLELNLIEPDFSSIKNLKGDKNVIDFAFKSTKLRISNGK